MCTGTSYLIRFSFESQIAKPHRPFFVAEKIFVLAQMLGKLGSVQEFRNFFCPSLFVPHLSFSFICLSAIKEPLEKLSN
jgi:hypothetical protein